MNFRIIEWCVQLVISVTLSILTSAAPSFPLLFYVKKLNPIERNAAEVSIERVTEITTYMLNRNLVMGRSGAHRGRGARELTHVSMLSTNI